MAIKKPALTQGKHIKTNPSSSGSTNHLHPAFTLKYLSNKTDFSFINCSKEEKLKLIEKINLLSNKTWGELNTADRHGLGFEKIHKSSIKAPLPSHISPDIEFFIAFRFAGNAPMVGYRENKVFYIIWLDRKFKLYNH